MQNGPKGTIFPSLSHSLTQDTVFAASAGWLHTVLLLLLYPLPHSVMVLCSFPGQLSFWLCFGGAEASAYPTPHTTGLASLCVCVWHKYMYIHIHMYMYISVYACTSACVHVEQVFLYIYLVVLGKSPLSHTQCICSIEKSQSSKQLPMIVLTEPMIASYGQHLAQSPHTLVACQNH